MNFIQQVQHIKQLHDALQNNGAKAINVGLTVLFAISWDAVSNIAGSDNAKYIISKK